MVPFSGAFSGGAAQDAAAAHAAAASAEAREVELAWNQEWIQHGFCRLCKTEATASHLLRKKHKSRAEADPPYSPACWRNQWYPVPASYLPEPAQQQAAVQRWPLSDFIRSDAVTPERVSAVEERLSHVEQYLAAMTAHFGQPDPDPQTQTVNVMQSNDSSRVLPGPSQPQVVNVPLSNRPPRKAAPPAVTAKRHPPSRDPWRSRSRSRSRARASGPAPFERAGVLWFLRCGYG